MREIGCRSYAEYLDIVTSALSGAQEWGILVDRLTVHETRFFRHPHSLALVRDQVLAKPEPQDGERLTFTAWSVGCATGEEAYSLAIVIQQAMDSRGDSGYFGVLGSDISQPALSAGRSGVYSRRRMQRVPRDIGERFFDSRDDGRFQVKEPMRKRMCFVRKNLLDIGDEWPGKVDVAYCQNLLIYFDRDRRQSIVDAMVRHLLPNGLLILGPGELVNWSHPAMERVRCGHTLAYRRRADVENG
jgi:type IV pilus assembly protein PilK